MAKSNDHHRDLKSIVKLLNAAPFCLLLLFFTSLAQAQFTLDREPPGPSSRKTGLVITEIMYNPRPVPGQATNYTHEFIELFNSKPWDEDLSGYFIDGIVRYTFASNTVLRAGAYLVLARVPGLIRTNYGITNVVGPWDGALTNRLSTEQGTIRLRNRQGAVLLQIDYHDSPPWPEAADGTGHSLSLVRPSWGENNPQAWAESDSVGGSPGIAEPLTHDPIAPVCINEWQNHSDPEDWIELYNHSNTAIDLSGAWLSDDPLTNKFRIPTNTIIAPRGFVTFYQSQLGFELFAGGETILLWNSNQTRIIDVIDFRGASNNVSQGRWPDGGPNIYGMATNTPGAPNSIPRRYGVVINEIMYNPISGSVDDEYVEIYNRGSTAVNLAGWEFVVGISYVFPTNAQTASMPAGAHWVVARNPANLISIYPNLNTNNTFGPYSGTLANGGERIVLAAADYDTVTRSNIMSVERLPVVVSDLTYGDGGKWGNWADGQGSSLELIDPEANERYPSSWADSDSSSASQWTAIEYNGPLGESLGAPVNDSLIIMQQGIGECLVDEVEVRVDNGPNLVPNGGFEAGLDGWLLQGSHDFSTLENAGFAGARSLHIRAGSRGDNQSNRILSAPFGSPIPPGDHTVSIRAKVRWLRGHPELLLRLHGSATEAYGRMSLPRRLGTPGQVNSMRVTNAGPSVFNVSHSPALPAANQDVVVTATAFDRQGVSSLVLRYRNDPSPAYIDLPMVDDGTGGDAIAGDGIFSATIPGQPAGSIAPFYVEARDRLGAVGTFPADVFPKPGFDRCWPIDAVTRECILRWGEVQMPGDFATYHLWLSAVNSNRWHIRAPMNNTPVDGTFIYNNLRVMYNALPLFSGSPFHRTNSTAGPAGPLRVDYEMNFADDDPLLGSTDFVLNNAGNPDQYTVSDHSAVGETTVYRIFEGMGLPNNHRRYIHFFVNGSQRSTIYERPGNFIFEDSQQPNGDMTDEWFPDTPGGQLFKVEDWFEFDRNGFDVLANNDADLERRTSLLNGQPTLLPAPYRFMFRKRSVSVGNSANDYSTVFALVDAVSPAGNPTNGVIDPDLFSTVADWETWMRHFAVERAVGNFDSYGWDRGKNDYLYQAGNRFVHMPWDIDYSLGLGRPANEGLFASNDRRVLAMFNTPAIVRAYWRAFSDMVAGPLSNAYLDPLIDARVRALTNNNINIDLDAVASIKAYIRDRRAFIQGQLGTVAAPFGIAGTTSFSTTDNLYTLVGTAPVAVKSITLNGVAYPMTWTSVTSFVMRVVLHAGANSLVLQGFDRFGVAVPGASQTVLATFTGLEPDPVGALVISEILYAPSTGGSQFIEIINRSVNSFDLSGWRMDGADATFPFGSIVTNNQTIVLARNATAFHGAYGAVPIFATFPGTLLTAQALALVRTNGSLGDVIDAVRWDTSPAWPAVSEGQSLQLIDITQDNRRPSNWGASSTVPATPGASNSVARALPPFDPVWLNEIQISSFDGPVDNFGEPSPWIEICNTGAVTVSLTGYALADNLSSNLLQWSFPAGTTLAPGEHKVIWADGQPAQDAPGNLHANFVLPFSGTLALVRRTNGQPQILDYLTWSRLGPNVTYGSTPEGQPVYRYLLESPTPGTTNIGRPLPVCINEFLASNSTGLRDPADSDPDDWIELYNPGPLPIDLGGFFLTDDGTVPQKYMVPTNGQYRVPAGGFLLIWADNEVSQNRTDRLDLHVSFKLGSSSGFIGLYAPDGVTPLDTVAYGAQATDVSEGRYSDGATNRYSMTRPTPRSFNGIPGFNTPPRFVTVTNPVVAPGGTVVVTSRATDPDPQTITYTTNAASALPGSILAQNGIYRWVVPTNQPVGDYPITITATDNGTPPQSDVITFTIMVRNAATITTNGPGGPIIQLVAGAGEEATFTIGTIPGRAYRVYYKDDVADATWTQLGPDFVAANTTASITDSLTAPRRFYLVALLP